MCLRKKYFFLLIFIALSSAAFGQAANTPFSTFGIGEPYGNALIPSQGMAGVGVSQPQFYSINNQNPALLVFNYYSSFQAGAILESRTIKADTISQKGVNGNLNYLVAAFPVKVGKWTTSFGLMPYTNVNYKLSYQEQVVGAPDDTTAVIERGDGGLTQFYWANGVRIHDDFSIGIKATYLFGSVNRDYSNLIDTDYSAPDAPTLFIVGIREQTYVKDFMFSGGLSYSKDSLFNSNYRFSAGLVYSFATKLKTTKTTVLQRRVSDGTPITSDTLLSDPGNISIPSALTFGLSLSKGSRWNVGMEFSSQDWSQYKNIENSNENLEKMWKVAIGGEYTPDALATNYLKRITYRAGMSYEKNPFVVENPAGSGTYRSIKDVGINFGFSLPTGLSSLDCGFRIGKRGDQVETVFEETYYKIYFGISFNDKWFIKRRFD